MATSFAAVDQQHAAALVVTADPFFDDRRAQIVALATRYRIRVSYTRCDFGVEGGLMSYGPVMRPTKFEFVINLKTAKVLGVTVPPQLIAVADEAIE